MKKVIIIQIVLSLILTAVFAVGSSRGYLDSVIPAMEHDNSITDIAGAAVETMRNIGVK